MFLLEAAGGHWPPERACDSPGLRANAPIKFERLPPVHEGRSYVPFSAKMGAAENTTARLRIYVGPSKDLGKDTFYVITLGRREVSAGIHGGSGGLRAVETVPVGKLTGPEPAGLFFRTKVRQEYVDLGLYEGGEEGSEPIVSVRDEDPESRVLLYYAFAFETRGQGPASGWNTVQNVL